MNKFEHAVRAQFPDAKERNIRSNARRLERGLPTILGTPRDPRPASVSDNGFRDFFTPARKGKPDRRLWPKDVV